MAGSCSPRSYGFSCKGPPVCRVAPRFLALTMFVALTMFLDYDVLRCDCRLLCSSFDVTVVRVAGCLLVFVVVWLSFALPVVCVDAMLRSFFISTGG